MRDVVVFILFVVMLPICMVRPWVGVLCFSFLAYNRTQDLTWGFARSLPLAQSVAIAMIVGWLVWEYRPIWKRDPRVQAMVFLVLWVGISMFSNHLRWNYVGHRYIELVKVIFVSLLTGGLMISRQRLRQLFMCVGIALGFYGAKNGIMYAVGGSETIVGPGGMLKDNNDFALAMVMNFPILVYMGPELRNLDKRGKLFHYGFWGVAACSMLTLVATGSRGGFLSLGAVMGWMVMKTRYKVPAIVAAILLAIVGWQFVPQDYKDRMATILEPGKDASAMGRLISWQVATNMIIAKPITGIGFNNMVHEYHNYMTGIVLPEGYGEGAKVAHNSYFQIWAESGTPAYLSFMFMIISTILLMRRVVSRAKREGDDWVIPYAQAIECTFIGFLVGATFLNRAHFDLVYQLVAAAACLPGIVAYERVHGGASARRKGPRLAQEVSVREGGTVTRVRPS